eukprot:2372048-Amphidinium_carterae.1
MAYHADSLTASLWGITQKHTYHVHPHRPPTRQSLDDFDTILTDEGAVLRLLEVGPLALRRNCPSGPFSSHSLAMDSVLGAEVA